MPDRRRSAMAVLLAASIFALPTSLLADQDKKEATPARRNTTSNVAHAEVLKAAQGRTPQFHFAGPSRFAIGSANRQISNASASRQYTEEELREIRAAQLRLVREMGAGPSPNPSGGVVLSHPTLGRIVLSNTGTNPTDPMATGGRVSLPNPGLIAGPSATAGTSEGSIRHPSDSGSRGEPDDFPVLVPGSGFKGPTAQPPAVTRRNKREKKIKNIKEE